MLPRLAFLCCVATISIYSPLEDEGSIQFSSVAQPCPNLCDTMDHSRPGFPVHHQHPEFTQTHVHRIGDAIQPSHPLSSPSPPAPNPSQHQGLFNESTLRMRWPKYWSFRFSIIPSKEIPGLISFRMGWLDLLAVQGTLKSLLQHYSSKASVLRCSAFFTYSPTLTSIHDYWKNCGGNPACRGTFGGRRKAVRDRLALQGGTGDFP